VRDPMASGTMRLLCGLAVVLSVIALAPVRSYAAGTSGSRAANQTHSVAHALVTYSDFAQDAAVTLESTWLAGASWRMCLTAGCPVSGNDWGADALTYDLAFRWRTTGFAALVPFLQRLIPSIPSYTPCSGSPCSQWSDVPMWDSIAAARAFEVTGNATALSRAVQAFAAVQQAPAAYARGACPDVRYQQPFGGGNHLKTLETDSNFVKAALLLYQETGHRVYLADATATYAAIRTRFLDPHVPLYTVYLFDDGQQCRPVPHRFFASVNGNMIENGLLLAQATHSAAYLEQAMQTARAVASSLGDARGIYADLQAENDIVEPLVEAMYDLATQQKQRFARAWLLQNASAVLSARTSVGYGRFFDGPPPLRAVTAWQTNGGVALMLAAAALDPGGRPASTNAWVSAGFVAHDVSSLPARLTFQGSGIALIGTIGEHCCEAGHARVLIDGQETVDGTGIWQNKSSAGRTLPHAVLFAWRWPTSGTHTLTFEPGVVNGKEGGSFLHLVGYYLLP
jgi:hypothetical protein